MTVGWPGAESGPLAVGLDGTGKYIHWGVIQLSVANLAVIGVIVVLFAAAVLLPFPGGRDIDAPHRTDPPDDTGSRL